MRDCLIMDKLICKKCNKEKELNAFSKHKGCKSGYDISACKHCKKSIQDWTKVPLIKKIFNRVKSRSIQKGLEFNIDLNDIIVPEKCPILGKPFIYGHIDWTYSLDRIDNSKGYIKGNVQIISNRANRLKGDFTIEEVKSLLTYLEGGACEVL